jgi:glycosyltransferase involved in cell wall biosynthesis
MDEDTQIKPAAPEEGAVEVSVVVPARNAEATIVPCLTAIRANQPREVIVVDGRSGDRTVEVAREYADQVLSDEGKGVAQARQMGAEAAQTPYVAFVDVDIELPDNALRVLLAEVKEKGADAIQADLRSLDAGDYWSRALAAHHNRGRSRNWIGLSATVFRRDVVLRHPFDASFRSGEDIEIRYRLKRAGAKTGISDKVVVQHKFEAGFKFALGQWLADGAGLGRMVRKYGWSMATLLVVPAGGTALGLLRSLRRDAMFIPYYLGYLVFNYVGIVEGLLDSRVRPLRPRQR